MKLTVSSVDNVYNRATRKSEQREYVQGFAYLPSAVEVAVRKLAREYRCGVADMVLIALTYYFGDGKNHLHCEHCEFFGDGCELPELGNQATLPLLD